MHLFPNFCKFFFIITLKKQVSIYTGPVLDRAKDQKRENKLRRSQIGVTLLIIVLAPHHLMTKLVTFISCYSFRTLGVDISKHIFQPSLNSIHHPRTSD